MVVEKAPVAMAGEVADVVVVLEMLVGEVVLAVPAVLEVLAVPAVPEVPEILAGLCKFSVDEPQLATGFP